MNNRRKLVIALGAGALITTFGSFAQPHGAPVLIGWLAARSRKSNEAEFSAFMEGLAALGWKSPQIVIEERWADGYYERLPILA